MGEGLVKKGNSRGDKSQLTEQTQGLQCLGRQRRRRLQRASGLVGVILGLIGLALLAATWLPNSASSRAPASAATALTDQEIFFTSLPQQMVLAGRRSGEGYFSADGRYMVYQAEREPGNPFYQIYLLDRETGETQRVSSGTGKTTCAWIHPQERRILFASTHLDPESETKQKEELAARQSPQQRRYAWDYDENYDLFTANFSGKNLRRLTNKRGYTAEASFSPDGQWVLFASNFHAYKKDLSEEDQARLERDPSFFIELYKMRPDGTGLQRLTHNRGYDGGPFFSADGQRIIWRRFAEKGYGAEIFVMDVDGSNQRQLTNYGAISWTPFFHPSGDYYIFASNRPPDPPPRRGAQARRQGKTGSPSGSGYTFQLYVRSFASDSPTIQVTHFPGFDGLPVFTPDGQQLTWSSARTPTGQAQIFVAGWDDQKIREALDLPVAKPLAKSFGPEISAEELRRHVTYLASEKMEGRMTGSEGERLAQDYAVELFNLWGLRPDGDRGTYFQNFEFAAGTRWGEGNRLKILTQKDSPAEELVLDKDWRPLSFSQSGDFSGEQVVFAGYGIMAPEMAQGQGAYDSYAGLDVNDKWVMVFRYLPEELSPEQRAHLAPFAELHAKAGTARDLGAKGIIVVSGPESRVKSDLVGLSQHMSATLSLPALSISDAVAQAWLKAQGQDLGAYQRRLDQGETESLELSSIEIKGKVDLVHQRKPTRNVLARLPASRRPGRRVVVIGAHLDHLGRGLERSSLAGAEDQGKIHYGADDNASGVAAVLEMAHYFAELKRQGSKLNWDLVFALWSGEELGNLGSTHYVEQIAAQRGWRRTQVMAKLNLDMVGRLEQSLTLNGVGSSSLWPEIVQGASQDLPPPGLSILLQDEVYLPTDTTPFYLNQVPILSAFTGAHEHYHSPGDTADKLNYEGLESITQLMAGVAQRVASRRQSLDYISLPRQRHGPMRGGVRIYLGTIPDYSKPDVQGMLISGVQSDGPAAKAGLRPGDVIVEMAGQKIENIYDYTRALGFLRVGEKVDIKVQRQAQMVQLQLLPEARE